MSQRFQKGKCYDKTMHQRIIDLLLEIFSDPVSFQAGGVLGPHLLRIYSCSWSFALKSLVCWLSSVHSIRKNAGGEIGTGIQTLNSHPKLESSIVAIG